MLKIYYFISLSNLSFLFFQQISETSLYSHLQIISKRLHFINYRVDIL